MVIEKSMVGGATLLRVTVEQIDITNAAGFYSAINSEFSPTHGAEFIVDLHAVHVLVAQGVNVLVSLHKRMQQAGGRLRLRGVGEEVYAKLRMLKLTELLLLE